jgi:hypothetical protein
MAGWERAKAMEAVASDHGFITTVQATDRRKRMRIHSQARKRG